MRCSGKPFVICFLRGAQNDVRPNYFRYSPKRKAALCGLFTGRLAFLLREDCCCVSQTWQRPTLPRLETKYHWRRGVSRPCSERERVQPPRNDHQVSEAQQMRSWYRLSLFDCFEHVFTRALGTRSRQSRAAGCPARRPQGSDHRVIEDHPADRGAPVRTKDGIMFIKDEHEQWERRSSIERLVPVSFMHCCTSTPGLSTWSSSTALIGNTRFQGGFPLRCLQRLSRPYIATLLCRWHDNRSTRGMSIPVLSY